MAYNPDTIQLVLANNGGWVLESYNMQHDADLTLAAFSDDEALLKALPAFLLMYRKARLEVRAQDGQPIIRNG